MPAGFAKSRQHRTRPGVLMVLCQGAEATAVAPTAGKELEGPRGREDGADTGRPCLQPAPGVEAAAGAEERRVCGCCPGLPWPRSCKAPGEEGEAGWRTEQGAAPCRWGDITGGAEEEEASPRVPGLSGTRGGARGEHGQPLRAPRTCTWGRRSARARLAPAYSSSAPSPPVSLLEERSGAAKGWPMRKGRYRFLVPLLFVF